jgi:hypothetical protein
VVRWDGGRERDTVIQGERPGGYRYR